MESKLKRNVKTLSAVGRSVFFIQVVAVGIHSADHATPSIHKFGTSFAEKRRSVGRYNSPTDPGHGVS
jgi:hypothetical protein